MTDAQSLGDLFEIAISLERAMERLYHSLAEKFAGHQDVADFWRSYAADEVGHAMRIAQFRDALSPEALAAPAEAAALALAHAALQFPVEHRLAEVQDLEDAYQLVNELENSETNAIFDFLITNFASDENARDFLRSQLKDHVGKLMIDFPSQFSNTGLRRRIKAQS